MCVSVCVSVRACVRACARARQGRRGWAEGGWGRRLRAAVEEVLAAAPDALALRRAQLRPPLLCRHGGCDGRLRRLQGPGSRAGAGAPLVFPRRRRAQQLEVCVALRPPLALPLRLLSVAATVAVADGPGAALPHELEPGCIDAGRLRQPRFGGGGVVGPAAEVVAARHDGGARELAAGRGQLGGQGVDGEVRGNAAEVLGRGDNGPAADTREALHVHVADVGARAEKFFRGLQRCLEALLGQPVLVRAVAGEELAIGVDAEVHTLHEDDAGVGRTAADSL